MLTRLHSNWVYLDETIVLTKKTDLLKEQVVHAAKILFMTHGYEAVGMRDIANSGIST